MVPLVGATPPATAGDRSLITTGPPALSAAVNQRQKVEQVAVEGVGLFRIDRVAGRRVYT